jgi:hypothetical protein
MLLFCSEFIARIKPYRIVYHLIRCDLCPCPLLLGLTITRFFDGYHGEFLTSLNFFAVLRKTASMDRNYVQYIITGNA